MRIRLFALCVLGAVIPLRSQHPEITGASLFVEKCSACHGDTAKGGRGPDLTTGQWKHGATDSELVRNIVKGIPSTQMPPIPMSETDARSIVAWLRSLTDSEKSAPVTGDPEAGRQLFFGAAGCSKCHMFGGRGAILGPDLTQVRARYSQSALLAALKAPWTLTEATAKSGQTTRGVRKSEDTFTLYLMGEEQKWHFLDKRDLVISRKQQAHNTLNTDSEASIGAFLLKAPLSYEPSAEWKPAPDMNVTFSRLRKAAAEPHNWLTYWGDLAGHHYSGLKQITPANVASLKSLWTYQFGGNTIETMPLVHDGIMFVTGPLNNASALDAQTGHPIWKYTRRLPAVASHCTVMTNRGFAMLGDRLYMATLDMHLVALDAKSGNVLWDIPVDDYTKGLSITHAPLAIDGKIIVGVTSGECALTGFVDAYDAATGRRLWRTYSIPQPGDPNRKTWQPEKSADFGGAPTWMTGTFDLDTNTIFWTTGNPGPDYDGTVRLGDNLYSCSVLALDADTGKIKWWFQFSPHDVHDWDANQTPVLIEGTIRGKKRKLLITAQRNAFYYVLDRETGEFLDGRAFAKQTWAKGLDNKGRPIVLPDTAPTPKGNYVCPDAAGATNWGSPSYDPSSNFLIVSVREACATYTSVTKEPVAGQGYTGGGQEIDPKIGTPGAIRALDALTGQTRWNFPLHIGSSSTGVLATGGDVVFASSSDGYLIALESRTGRYLWRYNTGANIVASPISYAVDGKQHVAIASQSAIFVFGLPE